MTVSNEELVKRIANLEAELAELKAQLAPPEEPKERPPWPRYDPSEGLSMPMNAMKPMVDLIHGKGQKCDLGAWARERIGEPGGFGPKPSGVREPERRSTPSEAPPLEGQIKGRWSK
jgi:hypothetical protein